MSIELEVLARPLGVASHEVLDEHQDVLSPVSERWHLDGKHVESIEEVLAKASIGHSGVQVTVGRRDDSNVDSDRLCSPDSLKLSLLQDSQERDLRVGRKFTYFIQEDRAAISLFKAAEPPLCSSSEGSFLVTKQLR